MPDRPIAYFLTFRCYGTWLPGDARGSVSRRNNSYGEPFLTPNEWVERRAMERAGDPTSLDAAARSCVDATIREVAEWNRWTLYAVNARSNHVHLVVGAQETPERVLVEMKAWSTRRLRETGVFPSTGKVWSKHGSTRYVWTETELERVCQYVLYGQDKDGIEGY